MKERRASLLSVFLIFLAVIAVMVYAGVAVGSDDALWFSRSFSADATGFDLYWDGATAHLDPRSEGYTELNAALKEDLTGIKSYPKGVGLSDAMLDHLQQAGRLLEVYYAEPVRVHSGYHFGASKVYYIPLNGPHATKNRVFNAARGSPLELQSSEAILAAAEAAAVSLRLDGP
jgi:hypothetical protein